MRLFASLVLGLLVEFKGHHWTRLMNVMGLTVIYFLVSNFEICFEQLCANFSSVTDNMPTRIWWLPNLSLPLDLYFLTYVYEDINEWKPINLLQKLNFWNRKINISFQWRKMMRVNHPSTSIKGSCESGSSKMSEGFCCWRLAYHLLKTQLLTPLL